MECYISDEERKFLIEKYMLKYGVNREKAEELFSEMFHE